MTCGVMSPRWLVPQRPPSVGSGIGCPTPTAAPAPAVAPRRLPWRIGDRLPQLPRPSPSSTAPPGSPASPLADRGSAAPAPAPVAQLHSSARLPGVSPGGSGIGCPSSRDRRPAPWAIYGLRNGENYKCKDHFKKFFPLKGELPQVQKNCKKGVDRGLDPVL